MSKRDIFSGYSEREQANALDWLAQDIEAMPESASIQVPPPAPEAEVKPIEVRGNEKGRRRAAAPGPIPARKGKARDVTRHARNNQEEN